MATAFDFDWQLHDLSVKPRVLILVSNIGHCLNDLLYRHAIGQLPMELVAVVSNHESHAPPGRVGRACLRPPAGRRATPRWRRKPRSPRWSTASGSTWSSSPATCRSCRRRWPSGSPGRVINIHHSFLPSFVGARPYHQAHERGVKLIGATAHYVTAELDAGPIIEQDVERVDHSMSVEDLIATGRDIEATVLARAVRFHLEHRVLINGERTVVFR